MKTAQGTATGGAIYNQKNIKGVNASFLNNYTSGSNKLVLGGAVYTSSDMTFTAGGNNRFFSDNYTKDNLRGKNYNAIFVQHLFIIADNHV